MTTGPGAQARVGAFAGSHLLLLDAELEPHDVISLVRNLRPALPQGTPVPGEGPARSYRITRHSQLVGPFAADAQLAAALSLPPEAVGFYALECPRDREPSPPPPWLPDVDGLIDSFPQGLPCKEEGRVLDELIAVARRLHLPIRLADEPDLPHAPDALGDHAAGRVAEPRFLRPDPELTPNLFVYSEYWLDPTVLLGRMARVAPQVRLPRPPGAQAQGAGAPTGAHIRADDPVVLDGYALEVPLEVELGPRAGLIEIQVALEDRPPAVIREHIAGEQIVYSLRWVDGENLGRLPTADPEFAQVRRSAIRLLERCARELMTAVAGAGVDESGFLVSAQQLGE